MQIIAGQKRGAKLAQLEGEHVRPTAQRTRESLFNILQGGRFIDNLDGLQVLDLFAGTGALGLEALSRGAMKAIFVEKHHEAVALIRKNAGKLGFDDRAHIIQADCTKTSRWLYDKADLVFCDPPYDQGLALPALQQFRALGAFQKEALIIIETRKSESLDLPDDMVCHDHRRYGMAALHFCSYR